CRRWRTGFLVGSWPGRFLLGGHASALVARTPVVTPNGQREGERRPLAHVTLDPDPPAVELHELPSQRQPEPRALLLASIVPPDLAELLEDRRLILGRNPDPRVTDGDRDAVLRCGGREADPTPLRGELHRVGQKVQQDLLDLPLVGDDVANPF